MRDLNNDQVADIVSANSNDGNLSVFLGRGDGTFAPANTFAVGAGAVELASADLNGDGQADLAVTDGIKSLYVVLGNGDGTFGAPTTFRLHNDPIGVEIADLNGDGKPDLAVANFGPDNNSHGEIAVLLGNGDGSFVAPVYYKLTHNANRLTAVDLNGDGKLDLAVAVEHFSTTRDSLAVLLGNGDGTFQPATISIPGDANDVAAADFNGDGKADLALAGQYSDSVRVALGNGDGTFQPAIDYPTNGSAVTVMAADLDRDGTPDLLVGGAAVTALLGNGNGTFRPAVNYAIGNRFAEVGYFNRDQALDVVSGGGFSAIGVAFGRGDGTFRAGLSYPVGDRVDGFDSADFNGDGKTDVVFGRLGDGGSKLALLFGTGDGGFVAGPSFGDFTGPCVRAADFNSDGKSDVLAISYFASGVYVFLGNGDGSFQPVKFTFVLGDLDESAAVADFNHDGKLDVAMTIRTDDRLAILLGNGDGTFQSPINFSTGESPQEPLTSDFDGDGNPDVAVSNTYGDTIGIYLGLGDGTFQAPLTIASPNPIYPGAGDFNRDGKPDLVVGGDSLKVFLGNGDGTFQGAQIIYPEYGPVRVSDVDGDGKLDVAVSADFAGLAVIPGIGNGSFRSGIVFATGSQFTGRFILADLNGDGLPEAIVSNISNSLSVLINNTRPHRP